jgi:Met-10+ like-protein
MNTSRIGISSVESSSMCVSHARICVVSFFFAISADVQMRVQKNPGIETVVNKVDTIDNEFRFFNMEVLAGRPDFQVEMVPVLSSTLCLYTHRFLIEYLVRVRLHVSL